MDPGTIGILVAEGAALAAIAAAYSLGKTPGAPAAPVVAAPVVAAPVVAAAPATAQDVTAAPVANVTMPVAVSDDDPRSLTDIVDAAIVIAKEEAANPPQKSMFRPFANTRDRLAARNAAFTARRAQLGVGRTLRRGGANSAITPFVTAVKKKLYAISSENDQKPQIAFSHLVSAGGVPDDAEGDKVTTLLLPLANAFTRWRFVARTTPLRYSPILVADAEDLYKDITTPEQIQRIFASNDRVLYRIKFPPSVVAPTPEQMAADAAAAAEAVGTDTTTTEGQSQLETGTDNQEFLGQPQYTPPAPAAAAPATAEPDRASIFEPAAVATAEPDRASIFEPAAVATAAANPASAVPSLEASIARNAKLAAAAKAAELQAMSDRSRADALAAAFEYQPESAATSRPSSADSLRSTSMADLNGTDFAARLAAAKAKFIEMRANTKRLEEKVNASTRPTLKSIRKKTPRNAAITEQDLAAHYVNLQPKQVELEVQKAARQARLTRRQGVPSVVTDAQLADIESDLNAAEKTVNEFKDLLDSIVQEPSVDKEWVMTAEMELELQFDYLKQVEADLATVPGSLLAAHSALGLPLPPATRNRLARKDAVNRFGFGSSTPRGGRKKNKKTRKSTFRRSRKH